MDLKHAMMNGSGPVGATAFRVSRADSLRRCQPSASGGAAPRHAANSDGRYGGAAGSKAELELVVMACAWQGPGRFELCNGAPPS